MPETQVLVLFVLIVVEVDHWNDDGGEAERVDEGRDWHRAPKGANLDGRGAVGPLDRRNDRARLGMVGSRPEGVRHGWAHRNRRDAIVAGASRIVWLGVDQRVAAAAHVGPHLLDQIGGARLLDEPD